MLNSKLQTLSTIRVRKLVDSVTGKGVCCLYLYLPINIKYEGNSDSRTREGQERKAINIPEIIKKLAHVSQHLLYILRIEGLVCIHLW